MIRTPSKRSKPNLRREGEPARRSWVSARQKVEAEGRCRVCGTTGALEAAHIIPRSRIGPPRGEHPDNIVPLCWPHHAGFDVGCLDLQPYLTLPEQSYAAGLVGLVEALRRVTNERAGRTG